MMETKEALILKKYKELYHGLFSDAEMAVTNEQFVDFVMNTLFYDLAVKEEEARTQREWETYETQKIHEGIKLTKKEFRDRNFRPNYLRVQGI